jgi:hypothetical protein
MVYGLGKVATILNLSLRAPCVALVDCLSRRENLVINSCTDITVFFWYAISSSAYSEYTAVKLRLRYAIWIFHTTMQDISDRLATTTRVT